jgi:hypothetical protein
VEVTDCGKPSSFLSYGKNYGREKFYSTGTRRESQKTDLGATLLILLLQA